jgi:hypothetical protein
VNVETDVSEEGNRKETSTRHFSKGKISTRYFLYTFHELHVLSREGMHVIIAYDSRAGSLCDNHEPTIECKNKKHEADNELPISYWTKYIFGPNKFTASKHIMNIVYGILK